MAYRDMRNLTEIMRTLGYPRLISMENFRQCNFPLVVDILKWLVERYDPRAVLPPDVDTEQDRVIFIKAVAEFMATKAGVKLNTKKLYRADGNVVRELLKVVGLLYNAMKGNGPTEGSDETLTASAFDLGANKLAELKQVRSLASDITSRGVRLFDLLGGESELRDSRQAAVARPLEIEAIERGVRTSRDALAAQVAKLQGLMGSLSGDTKGLEEKIEKKRADLERNQKRLSSLQSVRPAFMDEHERIEGDLQKEYTVYVEKFRNLSYLENQLEEYYFAEQSKFEETEESLRQMQARMRETDGEADMDVYDDPAESESDEAPRRPRPAKDGEVFGTMAGDVSDDTESELDSGSLGSDGSLDDDDAISGDDVSDNDF